MTETVAPAHVLPVPRWTLIIHIVQAALAIIILGLSAYGVRWIAYNALIYALVVCICTLGVCAYLLVSQLLIHSIYNMYIVLGVHAWMILFWIIDLGLVANLARIWSGDCYYYGSYGYGCASSYKYSYGYYKREIFSKREETTRGAYYGALAAGAFFAAVQFGLFVCGVIINVIFMNKHRSAAASAQAASHPPPQYVDSANTQPAVPMEKYNQPQAPPQSYSAVSTPQQTYAQPAQGFVAPPVPTTPATYQHEPIARNNTVSPVSNVGYPTNAAELNTPQHTGAYNPNVSELSTQDTYYNPNVSELSSR